jgi:hypothetical protein
MVAKALNARCGGGQIRDRSVRHSRNRKCLQSACEQHDYRNRRRLLPSGGTILPLSSSQLLYTLTLLRLRRVNQNGKDVAPAQVTLPVEELPKAHARHNVGWAHRRNQRQRHLLRAALPQVPAAVEMHKACGRHGSVCGLRKHLHEAASRVARLKRGLSVEAKTLHGN